MVAVTQAAEWLVFSFYYLQKANPVCLHVAGARVIAMDDILLPGGNQ